MPNSIRVLHRITQIPELIELICRHADPRSRTSLLRVSRSFFDVAAPIVWEKVSGVHNILTLLPGVTAVLPRSKQRSFNENGVMVTIPSNVGSLSHDRFDNYAGFVKRLNVHPDSGKASDSGYTIKGWEGLLEQTRHKVLLPSLLRLNLTADFLSTHEQCLWIRMFMSPTLNTIQIHGIHDCIEPLAANILLKQLALTCPELRYLSIFPGYSQSQAPNQGNNSYAVLGAWERPASFYLGLSALPALRGLTCTAEIFRPDAVSIFACLPHLEWLAIYYLSPDSQIAPPVAFVSSTLRQLVLDSAEQEQVCKILALGIFASLSSLALHRMACDAEQSDWETKLIPLVPIYTPALTSLVIKFDRSAHFSLTTPSMLRLLSTIPLHSICLLNVSEVAGSVLEALHFIWPFVSNLELFTLKMRIGLSQLGHFAKLPKLQRLTLNLFESIESLPSNWEISQVSTVSTQSLTLQSTTPVDILVDLVPLTKYLLFLLPNLEQFISLQPREGQDSSAEARKDQVISNALNAIIATHRATYKSD